MNQEDKAKIIKEYLTKLTEDLSNECRKQVQEFSEEGLAVAEIAVIFSEVEFVINWLKRVAPKFEGLINQIITKENWEKVKSKCYIICKKQRMEK